MPQKIFCALESVTWNVVWNERREAQLFHVRKVSLEWKDVFVSDDADDNDNGDHVAMARADDRIYTVKKAE